jgi:hypothetical protein
VLGFWTCRPDLVVVGAGGGASSLSVADEAFLVADVGASTSESEDRDVKGEVSPSREGLPRLRFMPAFAGDSFAAGFLAATAALLAAGLDFTAAGGIRRFALKAMVYAAFADGTGRAKELNVVAVGAFIVKVVDMSITIRLLTSS